MIAAILLGAAGAAAAMGGIAAVQGMAVQRQINFTRDNEMEADRVGIGYLAGAGFDAIRWALSSETLSRHEGLAATYIPAMLVDHPVTTDRVAEPRRARHSSRRAPGMTHKATRLIREARAGCCPPADVDLLSA